MEVQILPVKFVDVSHTGINGSNKLYVHGPDELLLQALLLAASPAPTLTTESVHSSYTTNAATAIEATNKTIFIILLNL
jgi:hypothetical protein